MCRYISKFSAATKKELYLIHNLNHWVIPSKPKGTQTENNQTALNLIRIWLVKRVAWVFWTNSPHITFVLKWKFIWCIISVKRINYYNIVLKVAFCKEIADWLSVLSLKIYYFWQIELRTKMVEAKYHEDKLKLQQQHDVAVQKVLWNKFLVISQVRK